MPYQKQFMFAILSLDELLVRMIVVVSVRSFAKIKHVYYHFLKLRSKV